MRRKQRREAAQATAQTTAPAAPVRPGGPPVRPTTETPGGPGGGGTALAERPAPAPADGTTDGTTGGTAAPTSDGGRLAGVRRWWPLLLLRAAHPRQALLTAAALGAGALLLGRATQEAAVVAATVLVGQVVAGWHHDLVDRDRDRRHHAGRKPLTVPDLDPGTVWFSIACGVLLVVPLAISTGVVAGLTYLAALLVTLLGNLVLRGGVLSWVPWAVSFGLYPAYLTYGGWGGDHLGSPPSVLVTVLAALLGVAVHLARSAPGLVVDHEEGWRTLPVRVALRIGASRVLLVGGLLALALAAALVVLGLGDGFTA
ncbi:hypothetical protein ENKNEFLB_00907 [Nocardioides aquaticus]|uniref:Prenyltransferase n=2 Tax=Nocardioides aquaticus TaxID=160826 RepID=A0ABX8EF10_9ACTN|nr:hypothetical protein [Nocardioides aquaticus]QVT78530.1 hypothetical protein ENKNEFLB_00907 [Nocardioides aquaticus]